MDLSTSNIAEPFVEQGFSELIKLIQEKKHKEICINEFAPNNQTFIYENPTNEITYFIMNSKIFNRLLVYMPDAIKYKKLGVE
jgi:hypothetical protein